MRLTCVPADWEDWDAVGPLAKQACAHLELDRRFTALTLVLDDLAADEHPWLEFPGGGEAVLYAHPDQFRAVPSVAVSTLPATLPWEMPPPRAADDPRRRFSASGAARFLHHHLLALADLADGVVRPREIPAALAAAYQEVWSVSLDGRLRSRGLPGYPTADRRRRFFRAFGVDGLLLPKHWDVFHAAWDEPAPDHARLLAWAKDLPRA
ncbi:MAG TPA: hypothetical protein P5571_02860 [Candidatus Krumholzibacteria bacterium]|nr:hypothetical protein [Candidatus Krumholzibacteria bacterium]HRX50283.1 hypothetical protein [Candidatus Krumholzibacteria bacterium]